MRRLFALLAAVAALIILGPPAQAATPGTGEGPGRTGASAATANGTAGIGTAGIANQANAQRKQAKRKRGRTGPARPRLRIRDARATRLARGALIVKVRGSARARVRLNAISISFDRGRTRLVRPKTVRLNRRGIGLVRLD